MLRLIRVSETPKAIPILYPSVMREICYWLLTGPHGAELCSLAVPESSSVSRFSSTSRVMRTASLPAA